VSGVRRTNLAEQRLVALQRAQVYAEFVESTTRLAGRDTAERCPRGFSSAAVRGPQPLVRPPVGQDPDRGEPPRSTAT
jgi:hypothetical protein